MSESAVSVVELKKAYGGGPSLALDGVSFDVRPGEIFGIIGPNGAGKTTLMGCLLGLLRPTSGSIRFAEGAPDTLQVRALSGYLPERLNFERWMTAWEFVAHHHALAGRSKSARVREVGDALTEVGLREDAWNARLRTFSRGMLQRTGLAQAILGPPKYLLLDEPSSGVDPEGVVQIRSVLLKMRAQGTTILLNSHQLDQVEKLADRALLLRRGRIESTEDLHRAAKGSQEIVILWSSAPDDAEARAQAAATHLGGSLHQVEGQRATFFLPTEEAITLLLKRLLDEGFGIVEATPRWGRLERKFSGVREAS